MAVLGASGYIGGRLAARLLDLDLDPLLVGRRPDELRRRWPDARVASADVTEPDSVAAAVVGVGTLYYLVHAMADGEAGFAERDRAAARAVGGAAKRAGVGRIIYLGGLGSADDELSEHLASRQETGWLLAEVGPPVLELRAGMVIGSGSASFRMLSDLVKRLPVMVTPRWVATKSQPIAIDDVVAYLVRAAEVPLSQHHTIVEIGGADVLSYRDMMLRMGAARGRHPTIVTVPILTPRLSSLWCGLVTSVPTAIARPLIDGLRNETTVRDDTASRMFPAVSPIGFDEAVATALHEAQVS
jgi:uncharacterized protein YbjT (DUF2867 family)